jgi:hypothetical protein
MDTFVRLTKAPVVSLARIRGCVRGVSSEFVLAYVSVVLCRTRPRPAGGLHWVAEPTPIERGFITLLCTLSPKRDRVQRFYVFEAMKFRTRRFLDNDPWLRTAIRLKSLSELYAVVTAIHEAQCKRVLPAESGT